MFLRSTIRWKDGKQHRYWSVVESRRVAGKRVVQRPVLYLGEINDSQAAAWRKSISVLEDGASQPRTLSLFPDDRAEGLAPDDSIVRLRLSELSLRRPRQWGACWLALHLWEELQLDQFWLPRLPASRKGTRWDQVLFVLVAYRLIAPGSEWRLYRQWFAATALADLLGTDADLGEIHKLYECHDRLLAHKDALFRHLRQRWQDLFNVSFDVLLYDLTSTYFEANPPFPEADKRRFGYSRDHRPDCVQVVIALVVTPDGLPIAYEVLAGNTNDSRTLRDFLGRIERLYGKARRVWLMDRGIPTEAVLAEMRASDPPVQYLVGTPKGRLTKLQQRLLPLPWQQARPGVQVKLLSEDDELSEGLNLHYHCFHLIHLDLPYNPNRLEQRNGRLDRYGQRNDPEIRYLYVPGTFEEDLLLHLIAKYERARATLDVMPDTLGITADPAHYEGKLIVRVSEPREDLFRPRDGALRSLDRSAEETSPETVHSFLREIDRAFDAFDLMAVCHGWHGARGFNSGSASLERAEQSLHVASAAEDLADFVAAVVGAEIQQQAICDNQIRLPNDWLRDLESLQGVDPGAGSMRFVRDPEIWHDSEGRSVAFLGRAHPVVMRAIRRGCRLPGGVAAAYGDRLGLLLTFEIEIRCSGRVVRRQVIAIRASPDGPEVRVDHPLDLIVSECAHSGTTIWRDLFESWTAAAFSRAENLASRIASQAHEAFATTFEASKTRDADRISTWLKVRADQLCGPFVARTGDLFGATSPGPPWRAQEDAVARLRSFATDPDVLAVKRREANDVLATFRDHDLAPLLPDPPSIRPIGMMMVVPRDVQ